MYVLSNLTLLFLDVKQLVLPPQIASFTIVKRMFTIVKQVVLLFEQTRFCESYSFHLFGNHGMILTKHEETKKGR